MIERYSGIERHNLRLIECSQCKYWDCSRLIMDKYGEGCGKCQGSGEITFCSHKCGVGVLREEIEKHLRLREEIEGGDVM